jgi:peptide/nickel transport system permease protein
VIRFLVLRLALLVAGLAVASILIFAVLRVLPGDVAQTIAGQDATPARVAALRAALHLDRPLPVQYASWIGGIFRGDLGTSLVSGTPIGPELAQKLSVTLPLAGLSLLVGLAIALPLGVVSGLRHRHPDGTLLSAAAQTLAAVPVVWAGLLLILVFSTTLSVLPSGNYPADGWGTPLAALRSLVLPALTIGVVEGAVLLRFVRSGVLAALDQDYVRTAAAKGMTPGRALVRHGLPNVGLSVVSVLGLQVAALIVGAVVVEQLFNLPGVGRMLVGDVDNRDLPAVQSELLVMTGLILVAGVLVDVVHRLVDPRQRTADP